MSTATEKDTRIVFTTPPKLPPVAPQQQPELPPVQPPSSPSGWVSVIRWTARIVGLCGAVLLGVVLIGDTLVESQPIGDSATLAISLFLFLGVLIAFVSDILGGAILVVGATASLAYVLANGARGGLILYGVLFAVDGLFFIFSGWRIQRLSRKAV
jgi:hypothetical protein